MDNICTRIFQLLGARCPLCHTSADGLCTDCRDALPLNRHACPSCALPLPEGAPAGMSCAGCQRHRPAYDGAFAPLLYLPPVDELIAGFKYHQRRAFGRIVGGLLADALCGRRDAAELLLPVPMHPRRLRERGFNHASEITRIVARRTGIRWHSGILVRTRDGSHQRGLSRRQRLSNIRGAFAARGEVPGHVALVDDVMTTGATAEALSDVLRTAGAQRVEVWAVARTPRDP